jgi:uncharacterized protein (DUF2384 family)
VGRHKVFKRAEEIFQSADKATIWVNKPNTALGGQSPVQAIETEEGFSSFSTNWDGRNWYLQRRNDMVNSD